MHRVIIDQVPVYAADPWARSAIILLFALNLLNLAAMIFVVKAINESRKVRPSKAVA